MLFRSNKIEFNCDIITEALKHVYETALNADSKHHSELSSLIEQLLSEDSTPASWEEYLQAREEELAHAAELTKPTIYFVLGNRDWYRFFSNITEARIREYRRSLERHSQRQPQGDNKSTRLAASIPVPPMNMLKGGMLYTQGIGV